MRKSQISDVLAELFNDLNVYHIEPRNCLSIETVSNNTNILFVGFVELQLELADHSAYHCV